MADSVIPVRQPRLRELSGKTFNLVLRLLGLTRFRDTQCGLKVFTREAAFRLFEHLSITGFAFDVELLLVAERLGLRVEEVPVEWRHVEESRVRPVRDGLAMLRDALRLRFARAPCRARRPPRTRASGATSGAPGSGPWRRAAGSACSGRARTADAARASASRSSSPRRWRARGRPRSWTR